MKQQYTRFCLESESMKDLTNQINDLTDKYSPGNVMDVIILNEILAEKQYKILSRSEYEKEEIDIFPKYNYYAIITVLIETENKI